MFTGWFWAVLLIAVIVFAFWPRKKTKPRRTVGQDAIRKHYDSPMRKFRVQRLKAERESAARLKKANREVEHRYQREKAKLDKQIKARRAELVKRAKEREREARRKAQQEREWQGRRERAMRSGR